MMEDKKQCKHEKVYSNEILCSMPAQYPWICKKCGFKGIDKDEFIDNHEYKQLKKKFENKRGTK